MGTREELMQSEFNQRRDDFLDAMRGSQLLELLPEKPRYVSHTKKYKHKIIEEIMDNYYDKQINSEVR